MICQYCGKDFITKSHRAKFCSDKCKVASSRQKESPKKIVEPKINPKINSKLTKTDQLFEDHYPNYYKFDDELYTRKCYVCDKQFTCHLELLKTCLPTCKDSLLKSLTTM